MDKNAREAMTELKPLLEKAKSVGIPKDEYAAIAAKHRITEARYLSQITGWLQARTRQEDNRVVLRKYDGQKNAKHLVSPTTPDQGYLRESVVTETFDDVQELALTNKAGETISWMKEKGKRLIVSFFELKD